MAMNIQSGDTDGSGDPIPEYVGKKEGVRSMVTPARAPARAGRFFIMEGIKGSEVPNMALISQIYNLLQLMTSSIVTGKLINNRSTCL